MTTSPSLSIRPYRPTDLLSLYDICLRTGASGEDGTHLYRDPLLLGHYYAAPYATLYPDTTFVVADDTRAVGYVLGVPDTAVFAARCEELWFPVLRGLYPLPDPADTSRDARMIRAIHRGVGIPDQPWLTQYPAHLHIDLLPGAQGGGYGRKLMQTLLAAMEARGVVGIHLGVGLTNTSAQGFYERLGFQVLERQPAALVYGLRLGEA
ncbi:GNAT family N-acetyltransferase [Deinococcus sp. KNUC1210]|uniref:GNAT family N-acetyltransferase n=1 Tax=Deinococcus sp. KNUC1210 TaxID=2917691 RepID=UPI001EF0C5F6|nr:GNAT family N-acetyltransferase [Deinococcus sp. KNUC1210]ULH15390.1 GNAT family N-acetyltransferase [Deinococcus sp. KNUC1210]